MGFKLKDEGNGYSNLTNSPNDDFHEDGFEKVENKEFDVNDMFRETTFKDVSEPVRTVSTPKGSSINWKQIMLLIMACIFLFGGISSMRDYKEAKKIINAGFTTDAVISKIEFHHRRKSRSVYKEYISYEVDGKQYNDVYLKTSSYRDREGRHIKIYYKESNPLKITTDDLCKSRNQNIYIGISLAIVMAAISFFVKPDSKPAESNKSIDILLAEKRNSRRNRW